MGTMAGIREPDTKSPPTSPPFDGATNQALKNTVIIDMLVISPKRLVRPAKRAEVGGILVGDPLECRGPRCEVST